MPDKNAERRCVACQRTADQVPLIALQYGQSCFWICPQHLPLLIHDPQQLIGKLPGVENLSPAEHKD
jgi:hypothetical protein